MILFGIHFVEQVKEPISMLTRDEISDISRSFRLFMDKRTEGLEGCGVGLSIKGS
jgi:hypothetical protein